MASVEAGPKAASAGKSTAAAPDSASASVAARSNEPEPPGRYQSVPVPAFQDVSPVGEAAVTLKLGALASTCTTSVATGSAFPTASHARNFTVVVWDTSKAPRYAWPLSSVGSPPSVV